MNTLSIVPFDGVDPTTEADVSALESEIGHRLPAEYRKFLLTLNGGQTSARGIVVHEHPDPYGYEASIRVFYSLSADAPPYASFYSTLRSKHFKLPPGHFAITDSHGNLVTIDVRDPVGPIYYFDHEMPDEDDLDANDVCHYKPKHAIPLAGSFDELLTRLAAFDPEKDGGQPWVATKPGLRDSTK